MEEDKDLEQPYDFAGNAVKTPLPSFRAAKPHNDDPDDIAPAARTPDGGSTPLPAPQPSATVTPPADEIESFYAKPETVEYKPLMTPEEQARIKEEYYRLTPGESSVEYLRRTMSKPGNVSGRRARWARTAGALTDVGLLIADMVGLKKGGLVPKRARFAAPAADKAVRENEAMAAKAQKAYDDAMADAARDDARRLSTKRREGGKLINDGLKADARGKFDADKANATNTNNYNLHVGDAKAKAQAADKQFERDKELEELKGRYRIKASAVRGSSSRKDSDMVGGVFHAGGGFVIPRSYKSTARGVIATPYLRKLVDGVRGVVAKNNIGKNGKVNTAYGRIYDNTRFGGLNDYDFTKMTEKDMVEYIEYAAPILAARSSSGKPMWKEFLGTSADEVMMTFEYGGTNTK